ncbi:hypothetical protein [Allobaculum sp. Allo2]|uniref:hypothetical protein n=1 Tax=Allobaculum sp. Allo2 TaxID=2853432 RepID=UPI001F61FACF|nr:hypothetical protein [Allobaculum sp. Allo2]UNT93467.1 hypothetical protein KWG61_01195 [Allobaculum sp. Allo2]
MNASSLTPFSAFAAQQVCGVERAVHFTKKRNGENGQQETIRKLKTEIMEMDGMYF